jgi:hypothetical protein
LSPAISKIAERHGSKQNSTLISDLPVDGGRNSFMFGSFEAVMLSTSGLPSAGPLRSRTRIAWLTNR